MGPDLLLLPPFILNKGVHNVLIKKHCVKILSKPNHFFLFCFTVKPLDWELHIKIERPAKSVRA